MVISQLVLQFFDSLPLLFSELVMELLILQFLRIPNHEWSGTDFHDIVEFCDDVLFSVAGLK